MSVSGGDLDGISAVTPSSVSAANSSTTPLAGGATFTGAFEEVLGYSGISIVVKADQASAALGVKIEWSANGSTVHSDDNFTHQAVAGDTWSFGVIARYVRIRYVNGAIGQGSFTLQTLYHPTEFKPSSHRVDDEIDADDDAELVKAVITGKMPNGKYGNASLDADGNIIVSAVTGFGADFVFGDVITTALTQVPVRRTTYNEQTTNAQRSLSSTSVLDTAAGTGARTVKITYLTATGTGPFVETVTLNGITAVNTIASDICFIESLVVITVGTLGSNQGIVTLHSAAAGVGVIGTIGATDNRTLWAHHYVATNSQAKITGVSTSHNGTTTGSGAVFILKAQDIPATNSSEVQISDFVRLYGQSSTFSRTYVSPITRNGPVRIILYVTPEANPTTVYRGAFDFFEQ